MEYQLATGQMRERETKIVVVGCGGTGGFLAEGLCRLFIGRRAQIILVDHDRVEQHNLLRQNFYQKDVGRQKSEVLAERLAGQFGQRIGYRTEPFTHDWMEGENDIIIGCVDNADARTEMHRNIRMNWRTWLIDAGNGKNWGQILIGNQGEKESLRKSFQDGTCHRLPAPVLQRPDLLTFADDTPPDLDCAAALDLVDQNPTINQAMANAALQVVQRMVTGTCPWMAIYLDLEQGSMTPHYATPENVARITGIEIEDLKDSG